MKSVGKVCKQIIGVPFLLLLFFSACFGALGLLGLGAISILKEGNTQKAKECLGEITVELELMKKSLESRKDNFVDIHVCPRGFDKVVMLAQADSIMLPDLSISGSEAEKTYRIVSEFKKNGHDLILLDRKFKHDNPTLENKLEECGIPVVCVTLKEDALTVEGEPEPEWIIVPVSQG